MLTSQSLIVTDFKEKVSQGQEHCVTMLLKTAGINLIGDKTNFVFNKNQGCDKKQTFG